MAQQLDLLVTYLEALPEATLYTRLEQEGELIECAFAPFVVFENGDAKRGVHLVCLEQYRQLYLGEHSFERVALSEEAAFELLKWISFSNPLPN